MNSDLAENLTKNYPLKNQSNVNTEPIINVDSVFKRFRDVQALKGVSLSVNRGEFIGLLGPNGAGKTTLIEILEGIQTQDSGQVSLLGLSWNHPESVNQLKSRIGLSLQETRFFEKLTVIEILKLFGSFYDVSSERINQVLKLVNLESKSKSYTAHLSGGQRQRLALGVAVLHRPEILFLDEPTTGLDPGARRSLWKILNNLKQDGMTMILTTHYMEEAAVLSDRIFILDHGRFIASGSLDQLLEENGGGYFLKFKIEPTVEFEPAFKKTFNKNITRDLEYNSETGEGVIHLKSVTEFTNHWLNFIKRKKFGLLSFEIHRMTLDDLFLKLTGREFEEVNTEVLL
ncbi:MAG: ABC transporter ATP-binding protein [Leptonema sp. (in: Bacteria)]|nr:ABC transporter ATP-binding protein [Leptonema sp. (in: bacteria)]